MQEGTGSAKLTTHLNKKSRTMAYARLAPMAVFLLATSTNVQHSIIITQSKKYTIIYNNTTK